MLPAVRNQTMRSTRLFPPTAINRYLTSHSRKGFQQSLASLPAGEAQDVPLTRHSASETHQVSSTGRYSTYPTTYSSFRPPISVYNLGIKGTRSFSTSSRRTQSSTAPKISLQIRPIQQSDEEVFKDLWEQYNEFYRRKIPPEVTSTTFARFLDDKVRMYAAVAVDTDTNKVIGFITWYPHLSTSSEKEQVYAHDAFVNPSVRNKGVARAMIEHVYHHAKTELDASLVYWHTQYYNHRAQLLYVKVADRTDFVKYQKSLL